MSHIPNNLWKAVEHSFSTTGRERTLAVVSGGENRVQRRIFQYWGDVHRVLVRKKGAGRGEMYKRRRESWWRKEVDATRSQKREASSAGRKEDAGSGEEDAIPESGEMMVVFWCHIASRTVALLNGLFLDHPKTLLHCSNAHGRTTGEQEEPQQSRITHCRGCDFWGTGKRLLPNVISSVFKKIFLFKWLYCILSNIFTDNFYFLIIFSLIMYPPAIPSSTSTLKNIFK